MIRKYTYLIFTDFVYVRAKGLIWCYNGLTNQNNIDKSAGDAMKEIYLSIEPSTPLIFDCKGISGITDHAWDCLFESIQDIKREIHFINIQKISQKITVCKAEFCTSMKMLNIDSAFSIYSEIIKLNIQQETYSSIESNIVKKIKGFVADSFYQYPGNKMQLLSSTPIYSNGEFDAAKLVSNPESFYWISLKLSDELEKIIQEFRLGGMSMRIKLLTVSLRSSPFAAAIGLLSGLQIETVDHFGPIFKNQEADISIADANEYVYIGDFTVGGTEIKISKTYALMKNSKLIHAVVIASLLKKEAYKEFVLHPLTYLLESCPLAKYTLTETK